MSVEKKLSEVAWNNHSSIERFENHRSNPPEVFLGKGVLKICSELTWEHPCRSTIFEIGLWHGWFPVNLLHIFRTLLLKNTSEGLLLNLGIFRYPVNIWYWVLIFISWSISGAKFNLIFQIWYVYKNVRVCSVSSSINFYSDLYL